MVFCGICRRQYHYEFNTVFWKSCTVFCAKPKEVDPINLISLWQINLSIELKYIINNSVWKRTESGHRWLQLFLFSLKMSITVISFYWRNDTPSFVTWPSRLATTPDMNWSPLYIPCITPSRVVVRYPHYTPLQWAEDKNLVKTEKKRVFLLFDCFMCNIVK